MSIEIGTIILTQIANITLDFSLVDENELSISFLGTHVPACGTLLYYLFMREPRVQCIL